MPRPTSEEQPNHRHLDQCFTRLHFSLVVLTHSPVTSVNSHAPWEKIRTVCGPRGLLWMLVNRGRRALEIRIPLGSPMEEANIFPWRTRIYTFTLFVAMNLLKILLILFSRLSARTA